MKTKENQPIVTVTLIQEMLLDSYEEWMENTDVYDRAGQITDYGTTKKFEASVPARAATIVNLEG